MWLASTPPARVEETAGIEGWAAAIIKHRQGIDRWLVNTTHSLADSRPGCAIPFRDVRVLPVVRKPAARMESRSRSGTIVEHRRGPTPSH